MKKTAILLFIFFVSRAYSQTNEDRLAIDFYPLMAIDTIYNLIQIDKIEDKHFFYQDENTINPNLFLCSVEREREVFGEKTLLFQQTLVKKVNDVWVLYDFQDYWGTPEKGLIDNTFYIISNTVGNSGHNRELGGGWSWGKESICFLDYKKMTISEELIINYGYESSHLENDEDIKKYVELEQEDDCSFIATSEECGMKYVIENSILTISQSYCKNETSRNKGEKTELIEKTDIDCPCLSNGKYQYIDGNFVKTDY
ncbi:hypothetical protein EI546_11030 [Aequorivita sp. H23M31]|uniref:Uncharacterized protein n=1 Tax=Aequorivita ciconiae TaxID=2494375 RepID=A0A410G4Q1_9FLAO|nr:hypothetical protein [Aequorivita sp. H23M31]QAA82221.1 hypothetical protein EI546_11030 [Aequorivita sp. H23M31]